MQTEMLAWLACPTCGSPLTHDGPRDAATIDRGTLSCGQGHRFPVVCGIPRFTGGELTAPGDAASIQESFGSQWGRFDYATDRVWGHSVAERRRTALRELDCTPDHLVGKLVLDAGCGAGLLSSQLADMGATVVAADITNSVDAARANLEERGIAGVHFVQADLARPPLRPATFDIVFSGGVLHHNRDTRAALHKIAPLVAPGGQIYVWLYGHTPGIAHSVRALARKVIVPLPAAVQRGLFHVWTAQSIARQELRRRRGRARPTDGVTYREKMVILLDHYTPRYRWEHTPAELSAWYEELGFSEIQTTELTEYGFGVLARRPLEVGAGTEPAASPVGA